MKNSIIWVKSLREYHDYTPEKFVPFCTSVKNQFGIDPDVPASGIPLPLTIAIYTGYISDVNTDIIARQNSKSTTLTADEHGKVGILLHSTDLLVGYIDSASNQKFPGDVTKITAIMARFGLKPAVHGKVQEHVFNVLSVAGSSATLQCPTAGDGSNYHWRWSADQKIWIQVKSTHKSTVTITNLPHDVRVYFQYDVSMPVGKGKYPVVSANADDFHWSDAISELIPA